MINWISCTGTSSTSPSWLGYSTPILVIIGWLVVHVATEARERRKQQVDYAMKLVEKINQIERAAIEYHCAKEREQIKEPRITWDLLELSHDMQFVNCLTKETEESIKNLRKAVTLNNFSSANFVAQGHDSEIARGIYEAAVDMRKSLKDAITLVFFEKDTFWNLKSASNLWKKIQLKFKNH